jgi:hypothetical protein
MATLTNPYTRQTMDEAVRIFRTPNTLLSNLFFSRMRVENSNSIQFDVVKGGRTVGAYVGPQDMAIPVDRAAFNTKTLVPPLLAFSRTITGVDLDNRVPGNNPFEGGDGAAELTAQDYEDLLNIIARAEELQAAGAVISGQNTLLDIKGNALGEVVNFGPDAAMRPTALAGNFVWGGTTSDPMGNLRTLSQLVQTYGDVMADVVVMRTSLYNTFAADASVQAQLDLRRGPDTDKLTFEAMGMGAVYRGMIDGMKIYTYDQTYKAPGSNTLAYYVPANKVIVGSTMAEGTRYYGQVFSSEAGGMVTTDRYLDTWSEKNPDSIMIRAQAKPLLVPKRVDAFAVQQVVA